MYSDGRYCRQGMVRATCVLSAFELARWRATRQQDDSTETEETTGVRQSLLRRPGKERQRALQRHAQTRQSFLEATIQSYQKAATGFGRWCVEHSLAPQTDAEIDSALVTWVNERHSEGCRPWVGERGFAAIPCLAGDGSCHMRPEHTRDGEDVTLSQS